MTRDQVADVVKARKQGRGAASAAPGRAEFRLDGGCKVTVAGLPDERPETVVAKLREALKAAQARAGNRPAVRRKPPSTTRVAPRAFGVVLGPEPPSIPITLCFIL